MKVWTYTLCQLVKLLNVITILYLVLDLKSTVRKLETEDGCEVGFDKNQLELMSTSELHYDQLKLHLSLTTSKAAVSVMQ